MSIEKLLGLPPVASSHGYEIDFIIFLMHILMLLLFVGWGIYFVYVMFRFNKKANPKADHEGTKSHVTSKLEVAVVVFELVLLFGFSIPFWAKQVNAFPDTDNAVEIRVVAEQFAWNFHHPGLDNKFGKTSLEFYDKQSNPLGIDPKDPNGKDDVVTINQLYLPIGRPAILHISSKDVMHSFGVPQMRVKQDAIPGLSVPVWFTPIKTGQFDVVCSQLCGIGHYRMKATVNVKSEEDYQDWLTQNSKPAGSEEEGYDSFWN